MTPSLRRRSRYDENVFQNYACLDLFGQPIYFFFVWQNGKFDQGISDIYAERLWLDKKEDLLVIDGVPITLYTVSAT